MTLKKKEKLQIANIMRSISQAAGKLLMQYFRTYKFSYTQKPGKANIVTTVDIAVQDLIVEKLMRYFPEVPIIGEEIVDEETTANKLEEVELLFLVDPLDGTLNFVHGLPFFAVSIALIERKQPVIGVVHVPALEETFTAILGCGAFGNGHKMRCNRVLPMSQALCATGWPYDLKLVQPTGKAILLMQQNVQEVRILGAAALELCYVAAGIIDVYWEIGLKPWDLAAGSLIVKEAGGIVSDINGETFDLFSGRVLACNSEQLWREVIAILKTHA